jgi:hypothetical protein
VKGAAELNDTGSLRPFVGCGNPFLLEVLLWKQELQ